MVISTAEMVRRQTWLHADDNEEQNRRIRVAIFNLQDFEIFRSWDNPTQAHFAQLFRTEYEYRRTIMEYHVSRGEENDRNHIFERDSALAAARFFEKSNLYYLIIPAAIILGIYWLNRKK
jgi:hypothetical protein